MPNLKIKDKKILIIEDEIPILRALASAFKKEKLTVLEAKNGKEGLDSAFKNHPDLILLDILMPVMDGIVMLKNLRQDRWEKKVPIIILTNLSNTETIAKTLENGAYDFLIKTDWKLEDVVKKVKEKLRAEESK